MVLLNVIQSFAALTSIGPPISGRWDWSSKSVGPWAGYCVSKRNGITKLELYLVLNNGVCFMN